MSKFRPATHLTAGDVLRRYAAWFEKEPIESRTAVAEDINRHLDELLALDAFGTESQCDPRGDHRG